MTELVIADEAAKQIERVESWWRQNRLAANLFMTELAEAFDALLVSPNIGTAHKTIRGVTIRRCLLRRSRYHVFFSYDAARDVVIVRAVWHATRGKQPPLR